MEIERQNGSKITLKKGEKLEVGRRDIYSKDKRVSKKQICVFLLEHNKKPSIEFKVVGKNPVWVYKRDKDEIMRFNRGHSGELVDGDKFCFYGTKCVWFNVCQNGCVLDFELVLQKMNVDSLDPVKEFGFLVIGHEFDQYPKHKIGPPETWDWFLEEPKKKSDDDEIDDRKRSKGTRRKRKKGDGNDDDDEWTGESEEDKELISKSRKVQRPKYTTRSKVCDKSAKFNERNKNSTTSKATSKGEEDDEEEEEDDDTLGGFIVKDEEVKEVEDDDDETELDEEEEEEEEEEDFDEDD